MTPTCAASGGGGSYAGFCGVALAVLLLRRGWSARQAEAVSLLLIGTTLVAQVHADWNSALSSARFAPFEGFKIVALVVAIVVPFRPKLAYALVGVCAVISVMVYEVMPAPMRAELPIEAPWTTVIYPLIATGILIYRVRALRMEREMMRASAQREGLERHGEHQIVERRRTVLRRGKSTIGWSRSTRTTISRAPRGCRRRQTSCAMASRVRSQTQARPWMSIPTDSASAIHPTSARTA